jgi:hypothetical protein
METLVGVSAINRGDMPSADMSGSAMAFMASQAITFSSGLQASANQLLESMGTGMVNIIKDFATTPRIATIAGKQNRPQMKEYTRARSSSRSTTSSATRRARSRRPPRASSRSPTTCSKPTWSRTRRNT